MGFGFANYATMIIYLGIMVAMGLFFMRRQKNVEEYFLGGRRFHWLPVAISMCASHFSAIAYIAAPAEAYDHGMMLFLFSVSVVLGVPLAIVIFVRLFRRLSLTTAYEYLERRFDLKVRLVGSLLFLLLRSFYLGVVLFASAVALQPITGWPVWFSVVLVGAVSTLYTTMGGMKSVIWTDVVQFVVLFGGIMLVLGMLIAYHPEGLKGIWFHARTHERAFQGLSERGFYAFDPFQRISLWILIVSAVFTQLGNAGADQISIQRYLSTRNEREAVRSMVWGTLLGVPIMFLLYLTGLGLFYFYQVYPEKSLPAMNGDQVLVRFISTELPAGVGGVVISGILAAVMSTVDSVLNSLSTCSVTDFYTRLFRPDASEVHKLRVAQMLTVAWGAMSIACAAIIIWLFGTATGRNPLIVISNVTIGFFLGILLGVFLLGVISRRANSIGVLLGAAAGLAAVLAVTILYYFREFPSGSPRLSFLWINVIGCLVTIAVGYFASLLGPCPQPDNIKFLTIFDSTHLTSYAEETKCMTST